jgi:hypothetical protein
VKIIVKEIIVLFMFSDIVMQQIYNIVIN